MRGWWQCPVGVALARGLGVVGVALAVAWPSLPFNTPDSIWYLKMVAGTTGEVPAPFAGRVVHTALARCLVDIGISAAWAFVVWAVIALAVVLTAIFWLHRRAGLRPLVTVVVCGGWLAVALLRDATLPDVHAAAWLAAVIVASARRTRWMMPLMVGAILCRESLALYGVVLAVLAWRDRRRRCALNLTVVIVAALVLQHLLTNAANVHAVSGPIYLVSKAIFNFSRNVLGCELYVNTIDYSQPLRTWLLPTWIPSGAVDRVGVCGFNALRPLWLLTAWSGIFGVLPGWMWAERGQLRVSFKRAPLWLRAALAYGVLAALVAPLSGTMLDRLVGYGWPAFWLAVPLLIGRPEGGWAVVGVMRVRWLLVAQLVTAVAVPWAAASIDWTGASAVVLMAGVAVVGVALNGVPVFVLGGGCLGRQRR